MIDILLLTTIRFTLCVLSWFAISKLFPEIQFAEWTMFCFCVTVGLDLLALIAGGFKTSSGSDRNID